MKNVGSNFPFFPEGRENPSKGKVPDSGNFNPPKVGGKTALGGAKGK